MVDRPRPSPGPPTSPHQGGDNRVHRAAGVERGGRGTWQAGTEAGERKAGLPSFGPHVLDASPRMQTPPRPGHAARRPPHPHQATCYPVFTRPRGGGPPIGWRRGPCTGSPKKNGRVRTCARARANRKRLPLSPRRVCGGAEAASAALAVPVAARKWQTRDPAPTLGPHWPPPFSPTPPLTYATSRIRMSPPKSPAETMPGPGNTGATTATAATTGSAGCSQN